MNSFPSESQYLLLMELGFQDWFNARWISIEDVNEVARRLQVSEIITRCDLQSAVRSIPARPETMRVWISSLAPGWSHIICLGGLMPSPPEDLTIGGHRLFEINFLGAVGEVDLPYYSEDGEGDAEGLGLERYRGYWEGLEILPPSLEEEMEMFLTLLGRITGRFLDRDWASSQGLLCRVP
ncbi:hypothetical protein [Nonomuraea rubra]|uniref:Uncharacterized protein n=1 Tax=Nonomuraea rubra TaxID=46180 RepID=A0A7X0P156_9ACTN|nr:hypothetical protein [Nonomuraea rubra]MBB6553362.1 hypothetical protein [Nonomuraea rubra]